GRVPALEQQAAVLVPVHELVRDPDVGHDAVGGLAVADGGDVVVGGEQPQLAQHPRVRPQLRERDDEHRGPAGRRAHEASIPSMVRSHVAISASAVSRLAAAWLAAFQPATWSRSSEPSAAAMSSTSKPSVTRPSSSARTIAAISGDGPTTMPRRAWTKSKNLFGSIHSMLNDTGGAT